MLIDSAAAATLLAAVEEGALDRAAARLHLTPSAVSQRIRQLEDQVGRRLLVRSRPIRATEAGEAVLRFARRHAELESDAAAELGLEPSDRGTRLTIAVNADSLATWFLPAIAEFTFAHEIEVELLREDQDRTARMLESGHAIAAVTASADPPPGHRSDPLGGLVYRAVAAPRWWDRWAAAGIDEAVLAAAPMVDYDRHDRLQSTALEHFGVSAAPPRHLVPSSHDFARAVEFGMGWAMLPEAQALHLIESGVLRELPASPITTPLHWQRWRGGSALLDALSETVLAAARAALQPPGGSSG